MSQSNKRSQGCRSNRCNRGKDGWMFLCKAGGLCNRGDVRKRQNTPAPSGNKKGG